MKIKLDSMYKRKICKEKNPRQSIVRLKNIYKETKPSL